MFLFFRRACSQVSPRAGAFRVLQPGSEDGGDPRGSIKQLGCFLLLLLGELAERSKPGPDPGPTHLSFRPLTRVCACGCAVEAAGSRYWPVKTLPSCVQAPVVSRGASRALAHLAAPLTSQFIPMVCALAACLRALVC